MFNLTGSEIVVILLLALVVLGPEKLPDAIRRFGKAYAELKRMGTGFQQEFKSALDEPMREMRDSADMLRKSADFGGDGSAEVGRGRPAAERPIPEIRPADDPPHPEPTSDLPFGADEPAREPADGGAHHAADAADGDENDQP